MPENHLVHKRVWTTKAFFLYQSKVKKAPQASFWPPATRTCSIQQVFRLTRKTLALLRGVNTRVAGSTSKRGSYHHWHCVRKNENQAGFRPTSHVLAHVSFLVITPLVTSISPFLLLKVPSLSPPLIITPSASWPRSVTAP